MCVWVSKSHTFTQRTPEMVGSHYFFIVNLSLIPQILAIYKDVDVRGDVWPKPRNTVLEQNKIVKFDVEKLHFEFLEKYESHSCDVMVDDNIKRYTALLKIPVLHNHKPKHSYPRNKLFKHISTIAVSIKNLKSCLVYPHSKMDESYEITVNLQGVHIRSNEVWGFIRGIETLSQCLFWTDEKSAFIYQQHIHDSPEFPHRGYMIDTGRHFITWKVMNQLLDGMAYSKFNILHWHIVDHQSFPYKSEVFPFLSEIAAYKPASSHTYSIEDIKAFIESAKNRGIRVIPELDTPGHMNSLCEAFAQAGYEFCVKCKGNWWDKGQMNEFYGWGPFRPDLEENYVLVEKFLKEFRDVFKDELVHLGGDEVPDGCWMEDESVRSWAEKNGMTSHSQIMRYHLDKVYSIAKKVGFENYQVWNEAEGFNTVDPESDVLLKRVSEGSKLQNIDKPILQSWLPWTAENPVGFEQIVNRATNEGYDVVLSSGWYLDLDKYSAWSLNVSKERRYWPEIE